MTRFFVAMSLFVILHVIPGAAWGQEKTEKKPAEKKEISKATVGDVSYVVTKSTVTGDDHRWTLFVEATSKQGDQKIQIVSARAIMADGKTVEIKSPMANKAISLPEGVKIQLELKMGSLPKSFDNVKTVSRLELYGGASVRAFGKKVTTSSIPGLDYDPKTRTAKPLVLENVPLDRAE